MHLLCTPHALTSYPCIPICKMLQIHICDEYVPAQQQLAQTLKDMQA